MRSVGLARTKDEIEEATAVQCRNCVSGDRARRCNW